MLEGLNACLDHRGEVFIPELGKMFYIQSDSTRLFGAQNPLRQGGARRGLPQSFLNRFTQVGSCHCTVFVIKYRTVVRITVIWDVPQHGAVSG